MLGFNDNIFTLARRSTDQDDPRASDRPAARRGVAPRSTTPSFRHRAAGPSQTGGRRASSCSLTAMTSRAMPRMETAIAQVEASDAMIYAVGQGRAVHVKNLQKLLEPIATTSGGRAFFSRLRQSSMKFLRRYWTICTTNTCWRIRRPDDQARRQVSQGHRGRERWEISRSCAATATGLYGSTSRCRTFGHQSTLFTVTLHHCQETNRRKGEERSYLFSEKEILLLIFSCFFFRRAPSVTVNIAD